MAILTAYDPIFFRLLKLSPFERRPRGGWRFGTKTISEEVVSRLIASGRAHIDGEKVCLTVAGAAE